MRVGFNLKISLAMIIKNEEKNIQKCIESVKELVDEIVIVDTGSTDNTINIIKEYPNIRIYHYLWCEDFSKARNFSIEKTTGEYILVLDGDEFIIEGKREELEKIMEEGLIGRILIKSCFQKDNQEFSSEEFVSRFFPRDIRYEGVIHEQLVTSKTRVKLSLTVKHSGYFNTNKSERNIPLLRKVLDKNPNDPYYLFQLGKELRINRQYDDSFKLLNKSYQLVKPINPYYKELVIELIYSGKECLKEEVLKVIEENEELLKSNSDFHFAKGLFYLDYCLSFPEKSFAYINKIESNFQTCLNLNNKPHSEYLRGTSSFLASYNLGVFYEVMGRIQEAIYYYKLSSENGYSLAKNRLEMLMKEKNL
jgi:glycosyltransferase involved in cell wall biosynthesis